MEVNESSHWRASQGEYDDSNSATTTVRHIRDKEYYFDDGSIVLLVQDHLFKIHRSLFERDSPFFRTLFSLPQGYSGDKILEGQSDDDPIVCQDSVEDFQALCWVVYSQPADILAQQQWETIDIPKLIRIVALSYKYDFEAYRTWALNALDAYSAAHHSSFIHNWGPWAEVGRIFNLATEGKMKSLTDRIECGWLGQISSNSKEGIAAFEGALDLAEGSDDLRGFHVKSYYAYLRSTGVFKVQTQDDASAGITEVGSYMDHSLSVLSVERRMRLLNGFWSLSQLRMKLSQAPKMVGNPLCLNHTRSCGPGWVTWWKNVLEGGAKEGRWFGDPSELIEEIRQKMVRVDRFNMFSFPCVGPVKLEFEILKQNFDASLASRFMIE